MTVAPLPLTQLFDEVITHALWHHAELECGVGELVALHEVVRGGHVTPFRQRQSSVYDVYIMGDFILYVRPNAVLLRKGGAYIGAASTSGSIDMRLRTPQSLIVPTTPIAMIS